MHPHGWRVTAGGILRIENVNRTIPCTQKISREILSHLRKHVTVGKVSDAHHAYYVAELYRVHPVDEYRVAKRAASSVDSCSYWSRVSTRLVGSVQKPGLDRQWDCHSGCEDQGWAHWEGLSVDALRLAKASYRPRSTARLGGKTRE